VTIAVGFYFAIGVGKQILFKFGYPEKKEKHGSRLIFAMEHAERQRHAYVSHMAKHFPETANRVCEN
jgi:hypothetical protein